MGVFCPIFDMRVLKVVPIYCVHEYMFLIGNRHWWGDRSRGCMSLFILLNVNLGILMMVTVVFLNLCTYTCV